MSLNTIALELVPPNTDRGREQALEEAQKVLEYSTGAGLDGRLRHVMLPGMIEEDGDRPVEMKPKMDMLTPTASTCPPSRRSPRCWHIGHPTTADCDFGALWSGERSKARRNH